MCNQHSLYKNNEYLGELESCNLDMILGNVCVDKEEMIKYLKIGDEEHEHKKFYLWHISELKIYDQPKELSDYGLTRAPQSWCYVRQV